MSQFPQQITELFIGKILPVVGALVVLGALFLGVAYLRGNIGPQQKVKLPYRRKSALLTQREIEVYNLLATMIPSGIHIVPQVRFNDLIEAIGESGKRNRFSSAHMRIDRKSVDFALFDANWKPLMAIELDDSTHQFAKRKARDEFESEAFEAAELPLVRIESVSAQDVEKVVIKLKEIQQKNETPHP